RPNCVRTADLPRTAIFVRDGPRSLLRHHDEPDDAFHGLRVHYFAESRDIYVRSGLEVLCTNALENKGRESLDFQWLSNFLSAEERIKHGLEAYTYYQDFIRRDYLNCLVITKYRRPWKPLGLADNPWFPCLGRQCPSKEKNECSTKMSHRQSPPEFYFG